jgi:anti-sigma factor RsiW
MNCPSVDLKALVFGELAGEELRPVEDHLAHCEDCRLEADRLRMTGAALFALRDEEVPRRIAFVSDKVFEPRWWQRVWRSGPALGFASAALLSGAILVHAFNTRAPVVTPPPADTAAIEQRIGNEVNRRVESAVAASEARQQRKTVELLAAAERRYEQLRKDDMLAAAANIDLMHKQLTRVYVASNQVSANATEPGR